MGALQSYALHDASELRAERARLRLAERALTSVNARCASLRSELLEARRELQELKDEERRRRDAAEALFGAAPSAPLPTLRTILKGDGINGARAG